MNFSISIACSKTICKRFLEIKTKENRNRFSVTTKLVFLYEFVNPKGGGGEIVLQ